MSTYKLDAKQLAEAWKTTTIAASNDDSRPLLNRTTHIEVMDEGLQLISTDSYILLVTFVPFYDDRGAPRPDITTRPKLAITVADPAKRIASFIAYAGKSKTIDAVDITIEGEQSDGEPVLGPELVNGRFTIETDRERITHPSATGPSGTFPDWRKLTDRQDNTEPADLYYNPKLLARIGQIPALAHNRHSGLRFVFRGADTEMTEISGDLPSGLKVWGLFMPMRRPR